MIGVTRSTKRRESWVRERGRGMRGVWIILVVSSAGRRNIIHVIGCQLRSPFCFSCKGADILNAAGRAWRVSDNAYRYRDKRKLIGASSTIDTANRPTLK